MVADEAVIATFRGERDRLHGLAHRLLGSAAEAEDALQEAWLRLASAEAERVVNLRAWLTTVVSRIALDMLRARRTRRDSAWTSDAEMAADPRIHADPEREAMLAESVGIALLVVLDRLPLPERLAFVLHDLFGMPFAEVAHILERSPDAARQLASRGRKRVRDFSDEITPGRARQEQAVAAFFAASRRGDFEALIALLDPDAELILDSRLVSGGGEQVVRGPAEIARRASFGAARQENAELVFVDGHAGIAVAPAGRLRLLMLFELAGERIRRVEIVADPDRLGTLDIRIGR